MSVRPLDQVRAIARATLDGFLQSDLMPQGMQAPALIWAAAFLVGPALLIPANFLAKYPFLRRYYPERVEFALWDDRMLFLIMSAGAIGVVAVMLWETLLPARRDAYVLASLPVPPAVQMAGRLCGLGLLFTAFAVPLNASATVMFPFVAADRMAMVPRWSFAYGITSFAADALIFFGVTVVQGAIVLTLGRRAAGRLGAVAQAAAVIGVLLSLLFMGPVRELTRQALERGDIADPLLRWSPLAWLLALNETIAGTRRPVMHALALRGVLAGMVPVMLTAALYAVGYQRLLTLAVEIRERRTKSLAARAGSRLVRTLFVRRPEEQAICAFGLRTLARSPRHRMLVSVYVGAGIALMITTLVPDIVRRGAAAVFAAPGVSTLSAPLTLSVVLAVAVRVAMAIPVDVPARWIFRCATPLPRVAGRATHKLMLLVVLPPVATFAAGSAWALWGPGIAWQHALYGTAMAFALCEILLVSFEGIPFTRAYVPGGARLHALWPLYLSAFVTYTYSGAALERVLLEWKEIATAVGWIGAIGAAFWLRRWWKVRASMDVPFESEPRDEMFAGFNLSEGVAANTRSNPR